MEPTPEVRDIGSQRELFVDDYLIDKRDGTELKLHHPQPAGSPSDMINVGRPSRFLYNRHQDDDSYRMYYRGRYVGPGPHLTSYAESTDGKDWTKPDLGPVEVNSSTNNNVILPFNGQFCAFIDTRPGVTAAERYKANARDQQPPGSLIGYVSADGIHWRKLRDEPIVPVVLENNFDSQSAMFWSKLRTAMSSTPVIWSATIAFDPPPGRRQRIFQLDRTNPDDLQRYRQ